MVSETSINSLCHELDLALISEMVRPEDVEVRFRLLQPLETVVARHDTRPQVPDTPAGRIATVLWFKHNPKDADLHLLLSYLQDATPIVRQSAADAIAATVKSSPEKWSDRETTYIARQVFQERRTAESSSVVSYQVAKLAEEVDKLPRSRKRKAAKVVLNPYIAGLPVSRREQFFGRKDVLKDIENTLGRKEGIKSIVLYGARRTGKTSILYQIKDGALGEAFLPVYLDMQALAGAQLSAFLRGLVLKTQEAVQESKPLLAQDLLGDRDVDFPFVQNFFQNLLSKLENTYLLLLMDEYEVLKRYFSDSTLAMQFQHLIEQERNLFVIFAGSHKLESLREKRDKEFVRLLDVSRYIKISFLRRDDALKLIEEPTSGILKYSKDVPEQILELTAGHPFYTQLLCQSLFDAAQETGEVTLDNLTDAVSQFLQNPSPHLILTWNGLQLDQRVVGSALSELQSEDAKEKQPSEIADRIKEKRYPVKFSKAKVHHSLTALQNIDWVAKTPYANEYRFTMELVRRWVGENHSILDLAEEHREMITSQAAGFLIQKAAWLIDFLILIAIAATIWIGLRLTGANALLVMLPIAVCYFVLPVVFARSTLGMRLAQIRIVTTSALAPESVHSVGYGLLLAVRFSVELRLIWTVFEGVNSPRDIVFVVIAGFLVIFDNLAILFGGNWGLFERVARIILVRSAAVRE